MADIILRDYQEQAVDKAVRNMGLDGHDLIVLATGAGKSIVIAEIVNRVGQDALILQPSREILMQNVSKLRHFVPTYDIGIYSASAGKKFVNKYTFAMIGSIYKKPELFVRFGFILIDEAHLHNIKNTGSMYHSFLAAVNDLRSRMGMSPIKVIGLTATPYRNMQGYHRTEDGALIATVTLKLINRIKPEFWKRILISIGVGDLIAAGYLCPLEYVNKTFMTHEEMKLNKSQTEFDLDNFAGHLGNRQRQIVESVLECQKKYRSVLVFCPTVANAERYAEVVPGAACVSAKTPDDERDSIIRNFKAGRIQTVFNMNVLTIGFDHPELDCIHLLRPTRSMLMHVQMIGRGVRTAPGKTHCTVFDWTNNVEKLGRVETVEVRKEQFPEFKFPMWEIFSETADGEKRWHGEALYSYAIKQAGYQQSVAKKYNVGFRRRW